MYAHAPEQYLAETKLLGLMAVFSYQYKYCPSSHENYRVPSSTRKVAEQCGFFIHLGTHVLNSAKQKGSAAFLPVLFSIVYPC